MISPLKIDEYIYYPERKCLVLNGVTIRIAENENRLLNLLIGKKNTLVTKDEIIESLWGEKNVIVDQGSVNTAISKLRKCFDDTTVDSRIIRTVRGRGYIFIAEVTELSGEENTKKESSHHKKPEVFVSDQNHFENKKNLLLRLSGGGIALFLTICMGLYYLGNEIYSEPLIEENHFFNSDNDFYLIRHFSSQRKARCVINNEEVVCTNE